MKILATLECVYLDPTELEDAIVFYEALFREPRGLVAEYVQHRVQVPKAGSVAG